MPPRAGLGRLTEDQVRDLMAYGLERARGSLVRGGATELAEAAVDAEDLVQDALEFLWRRHRREIDQGRLEELRRVFGMAVGDAVKQWRRWARTLKQSGPGGRVPLEQVDQAGSGRAAVEEVAARDAQEHLRGVMAVALAPEDAQLVLLRAEGLDYDEVARRLGWRLVPAGVVSLRQRHCRAVSRLRALSGSSG